VNLNFSDNAWHEYLYWQQKDKKTLQKVNKLIKEIKRTPFEGSGKPEPLKHELSGWWSRRINERDRIVYRISDDTVDILQLRYHY